MILRVDRVVGRAGDVLLDAAVVAFAWWTLIYDLALPAEAPVVPLFAVWLGACAATLAGVTLLRRRRAATVADTTIDGTDDRRTLWWVVAAIAAAVVTVNVRGSVWPLAWLAPAAVVAAAGAVMFAGRRVDPRERTPAAETDEWRRVPANLVTVFVGVALGVFSLFVVRVSNDDVYYLNRAAWVQAHGRIPLRDTIFGNQVYPPLTGQKAPVASIEALQGTLARVLGISAGSAAYYLTTFAATVLAVWALWRLVRRWTANRALLGFLVAIGYLLLSGVGHTTYGNFHFVRLWQGKSILVSLLVPVAFAYLTEWWERRRPATALLLLAAGVAGVGLSTTGVLLLPLLAAAGALPAVLRRDLRGLTGPVLLGAYAVAVGIGIHFAVHAVAGPGAIRHPADVFGMVLGTGLVAATGWAAVLAAPRLAGSRAASQVALGAAVVALVVTAPGVLGVLNTVTGAGQVLWRMLWVAPAAGALATVVAIPLQRWWRLAGCAALVVALIFAGRPLWSSANHATVRASPSWKLTTWQIENARAIAWHAPRGTVVLAPVVAMEALAQTTARVYTVGPRDLYVGGLDSEDGQLRQDRLELTHWASWGFSPPVDLTSSELRSLLRTLHVGYACVVPGRKGHLLREAGYTDARTVGTLKCFRTNG